MGSGWSTLGLYVNNEEMTCVGREGTIGLSRSGSLSNLSLFFGGGACPLS